MHSTLNIDDGYRGSSETLLQDIIKYGKENFKIRILHRCSSRGELYEYEAFFITPEFVNREDTYNIVEGGGTAPLALKKEYREKIRNMLK